MRVEIIRTDTYRNSARTEEQCERRVGRFGLPVPSSPYGLCGRKATFNLISRHSEVRSCVKVTLAVLGSPSPVVLTVSMDVMQH